MPLSRRRVFAGKLYERETGGTANVFLASETLGGARKEVVFKLRDGEVTEDERESTRLVEGVGTACGLVRPVVALEWVAELQVMAPMRANAVRMRLSSHKRERHGFSNTVAARFANAISIPIAVTVASWFASSTRCWWSLPLKLRPTSTRSLRASPLSA